MKLFYSPGACSLSPHIVLREAGLKFELERVDLQSGKTEHGETYARINPKGYVPALRLSDGEVLTEGAAIVQYLGEQAPDAGLVPPAATLERARMQEHLNFVASELHKAFGPLFIATSSEEAKQSARSNVARKFDYLEKLFADKRDYLLGKKFSVADAYLFAVSNWAEPTGIAMSKWPRLAAFIKRVGSRPLVQAAMKAEGLV